MVSPFAGVFSTTSMARERRVVPEPPDVITYDDAGQPVYPTETQTLVVIADAVNATRANALREQAGASAVGTILVLTCVDPMTAPADVVPGVEFDLPYGGQDGVARIIARPVETLDPVQEALGDVLYAAWRATP
jgi:hypothetical protein